MALSNLGSFETSGFPCKVLPMVDTPSDPKKVKISQYWFRESESVDELLASFVLPRKDHPVAAVPVQPAGQKF